MSGSTIKLFIPSNAPQSQGEMVVGLAITNSVLSSNPILHNYIFHGKLLSLCLSNLACHSCHLAASLQLSGYTHPQQLTFSYQLTRTSSAAGFYISRHMYTQQLALISQFTLAPSVAGIYIPVHTCIPTAGFNFSTLICILTSWLNLSAHICVFSSWL